MRMKYLAVSLSLATLLFTSCGGWTEEDQESFMEACEKKNDRAYCDCTLGKMMDKFDKFADIQDDQAAMAEILSSEECLGAAE